MDTDKIQNIKNQAISSILAAGSLEELERLRIHYLGRKGLITSFIRQLPNQSEEKRKEMGASLNVMKVAIEDSISRQQQTIQSSKLSHSEWLDVSLPGEKPLKGHLHLITDTIKEIVSIFSRIGFTPVSYPEVDWDWYAFGGLNMPENHPARDEWETFFIEGLKNSKLGSAVLTPHTSSGQIREMERMGQPPIRMLNIAKCYRRQSDVSHAPMFYQFEGLVIDKNVSITHLKGTLDYFAKQYFGPNRKTRIRPFHFQFTEPSFEVDVSCGVCGGKSRLPGGQTCQVCKGGWMELGGSGMVHPIVLRNGGIDPKKYSGFAWGWGVERVLMMKYGIPDIRLLFANDLKFLNQF